jgi:hypothetical protein
MTKNNPNDEGKSFNQDTQPNWQWITDADRQKEYDNLDALMDKTYSDVRPVEMFNNES